MKKYNLIRAYIPGVIFLLTKSYTIQLTVYELFDSLELLEKFINFQLEAVMLSAEWLRNCHLIKTVTNGANGFNCIFIFA